MVLWVFPMARVIVKLVLVLNATHAQSVCHSLKHMMLMLVDTLALKMEVGKKEYTPEFTETMQSSRL